MAASRALPLELLAYLRSVVTELAGEIGARPYRDLARLDAAAQRIGRRFAHFGYFVVRRTFAYAGRHTSDFTMVELERDCPGVSREMIRRVLREERAKGQIACVGRGPAARWSGRR